MRLLNHGEWCEWDCHCFFLSRLPVPCQFWWWFLLPGDPDGVTRHLTLTAKQQFEFDSLSMLSMPMLICFHIILQKGKSSVGIQLHEEYTKEPWLKNANTTNYCASSDCCRRISMDLVVSVCKTSTAKSAKVAWNQQTCWGTAASMQLLGSRSGMLKWWKLMETVWNCDIVPTLMGEEVRCQSEQKNTKNRKEWENAFLIPLLLKC